MERLITSIVAAILLLTASGVSASDEMKARIKVSGGGTYDYFMVGMRADAKDGFDNAYDTFAPGSNLNASYISAFFSHPEWHAVKSEFRGDIRAPKRHEEWTLSVYTNLPAGTTLTMALLEEYSTVPVPCTLTVEDSDAGWAVSLLDTPYDFPVPPNKQLMYFRIVSECR